MPDILVLNGPNLNLLGTRAPDIYGTATLSDIETGCQTLAAALGHELTFSQHNHEGALVDLIHQAGADKVDWLIINPAAFTHTSVAIRDAIEGVALPLIEVHMTNIYQRETFRRKSYLSDIAVGTITGLGSVVYELAIIAAHHHLTKESE